MPPILYDPPDDEQTAALEQQGGCLSGFLIPPLAVLVVGILLALVLMSASPVTSLPALAAAPVQVTQAGVAPVAAAPMVPTAAAVVQTGAISQIFRPEVLYWTDAIQRWAAKADLDPNLVATVMQIESCGDPKARSSAGAMGLFQVMPYHFATGEDPYDPDTNAYRGLDYLKRSLAKANGNARLALAGYNGGIGVIGRMESSWAGQTQRYAYWGSGIYNDAAMGSSVSQRMQEWFSAGGGLCKQAHDRLGITP